MATISLRVIGRHRNNPRHRGEARQLDLVDIKTDYIVAAESIEGDVGKQFTEEILNLDNTNSVEEQVQTLKRICDKYLKKEWEESPVTFLLVDLVTDIYLQAVPKSPMKNVACRALHNVPGDIYRPSLSKALCEKLQASGDNDLSQINRLANSLLCCLESFPLAMAHLSVVASASFLARALQLCVIELGKDLSPATSSAVFGYAHLCTRCAITLLQGWQLLLKEWAQQDMQDMKKKMSDSQGDHQCTNHSKAENTISVIRMCIKDLLDNEETPMDTKFNCGLLLVLLEPVLEDENSWLKFLELLTSVETYKNTSGVTKLSIAAGLLKTLETQQLFATTTNIRAAEGVNVFLMIYKSILETINRNSSDSAVVLAGARTMQLLCRQLRQHAENSSQAAIEVAKCLVHCKQIDDISIPPILEYIWTHMEHCMDSVRHSARYALQCLVQIGASFIDAYPVLEKIRKTVLTTSPDRKSKYIGLAVVSAEAGCFPFLEMSPTLPKDMLSYLKDRTVTPHVVSACESLMKKNWFECKSGNEEMVQAWGRMWVDPLLQELARQPSPAVEQLVGTAAEVNPSAVTIATGGAMESGVNLRATLAWLRVAHRQGALDTLVREGMGCPSLWKGVLSYDVLEAALLHANDEIRTAALALLVEGHRSTEPFTSAELLLVRTFLRHNINVQEPAARQQGLSLIKKLLERIRDSCQALERIMKTAEKAGKSDKDAEKSLGTALLFLQWLVEFSFSSIFPGANFSRRGSALQILTFCSDIMGQRTPADMWLPCNGVTLLECLKDTYELNKVLAHKLIIKYPVESLELDDEVQCLTLVSAGLTLSDSPRPPDCVTAAFLLSTLAKFTKAPSLVRRAFSLVDGMEDPLPPGDCTYEDMVLAILKLLKDRLLNSIDAAHRNLLEASATHPLYGPLFCIRHMLQSVSFREVGTDEDWQEFISEMIDICFEATGVVEEVVNSSSPEGHLPMDFTPGEDLLRRLQRHSAEQAPYFKNVNCSAQMLLLCSWRTVKEVSLLLGDIAERAPIARDDNAGTGLVTEMHLLDIGAHLSKLLCETKHRGAFEQAYVGFSSLCRRLWSGEPNSNMSRLHKVPTQWLQQLLLDIRQGLGDATRRSAGLPFMVQALVTTEAQARGCGARIFQDTMNVLLALALDEQSVAEARTHALNILRALFRNSQLGEMVTPHISSGFEAALGAFHSRDWAVRNSGTLLYAALMTRVFGVQRTRGCNWQLTTRNRMTGRVFFQRFPRLYDVLLRETGQFGRDMVCLSLEATKWAAVYERNMANCELRSILEQNWGSQAPALLLLLARLYPSSLEGTDSNLQLSAFVPFVLDCARSSVFKTRVLAAQALVPLVNPGVFEDTLGLLFNKLAKLPESDLNYRHGILLQLLFLVSATPDELLGQESYAKQLSLWLSGVKPTCKPSYCPTVDTARLALLQASLSKINNSIDKDFRSKLHEELSTALGISERRRVKPDDDDWTPGLSLYEKVAASFLLLLSVLDNNKLEYTVLRLLSHSSYEVVEMTLNFLLRNAFNDYTYEEEIEEEYVFELPAIKLSPQEVCNWPRIRIRIMELAGIPASRGKATRKRARQAVSETQGAALLLLCYLPPPTALRRARANAVMLLNIARTDHFSTGRAALTAATAMYAYLVARKIHVPSNFTRGICSLILRYSAGNQRIQNRRTAAYLLSKYRGLLVFPAEEDQPLPTSATCSIWTSIMLLLDDDEPDIRKQVSELVPGQRTPVVAHRARELLMSWFMRHNKLELHHLGALLCAWALGPADEIIRGVIEEPGVFEQSESNVFREGAALCELACLHMRSVTDKIGKDLLVLTQEPCMRGWLAKWWLIPEGIFTTLYEFLGLVIKPSCIPPEIDIEGDNMEPMTVCDHFVAPPGTAKVYLTKYRARCVREVLEDILTEPRRV